MSRTPTVEGRFEAKNPVRKEPGKKCEKPSVPRKLDGEGEAKLIAMRLGKPPEGYGRWSLQLLADRLVSLEIVESISHETVRKTLKITALPSE